MTAQEIHKYIWESVRDMSHLLKFPIDGGVRVTEQKKIAVQKLRNSHRISTEAYNAITRNSCCVVCALYPEGEEDPDYAGCNKECPIYSAKGCTCNNEYSSFQTVVNAHSRQAYERGCDEILAVDVLGGKYDEKIKNLLEQL